MFVCVCECVCVCEGGKNWGRRAIQNNYSTPCNLYACKPGGEFSLICSLYTGSVNLGVTSLMSFTIIITLVRSVCSPSDACMAGKLSYNLSMYVISVVCHMQIHSVHMRTYKTALVIIF